MVTSLEHSRLAPEALRRAALEQLPCGVGLDADGAPIDVNPAAIAEARALLSELLAEQERLRQLNQLARTFSHTLDPTSLLTCVVATMGPLLEAAWCAVGEYEPASERLQVRARWRREEEGVLQGGAILRLEECLGTLPADAAGCIAADDLRALGEPMAGAAAAAGVHSVLGVPIAVDDRPWGMLLAGWSAPQGATAARTECLATAVSHLALAIKNATLYAELRASHEALRQTQQRGAQRERMHALGQMASGIVHDFNNALSPLLGFSELLVEHPETWDDRETLARYLQFIYLGAQDAAGVVARLREFYRKPTPEELQRPVELDRLAAEVAALTRPRWKDQALAENRTIALETDLEAVPGVAGDERALREMLTNLVFNAVDALPTGGTIWLRTRREDEAAVLEVADSGIGMTDEVRERCLEPFFSTKGTKGTGLGLSLVYGIVERHGGTLDIVSAPGEGTTFRIRLPRRAEQAARAAPAPERAPVAVDAPTGLRVLVVDDEPLVREVTAQYLLESGHSCETAANGREGLERFCGEPFDLVITDQAMPELSGDQLAAAIEASGLGTPVILMTGFGDILEAQGELPGGVAQIISKPVRGAVLRAAIAQVMAGGRA